MHLDEETLERVLHQELDAERETAARAHLAGCRECEAALEKSRRRENRVFGLLEALDHDTPAFDGNALGAAESGPSGRILLAASIACVLAAGILYALPDSPLRSWIDRLGDESPARETESAPDLAEPVSGLSIRPTAPFEIVFAGGQAAGIVELELVETPAVEIRVLGVPVPLESGPDRVSVVNPGSRSSYAIRLPAEGPPITVRIGEEPVFVKSAGRLETSAPRTDSGAYRIDLARSGS